jgi:hypothetical protein
VEADCLLWVWLSGVWKDWRSAMVISRESYQTLIAEIGE